MINSTLHDRARREAEALTVDLRGRILTSSGQREALLEDFERSRLDGIRFTGLAGGTLRYSQCLSVSAETKPAQACAKVVNTGIARGTIGGDCRETNLRIWACH